MRACFRRRLDGKNGGMNAHAVSHWTRHPIQAVEEEAKHLHDIEKDGTSGATPLISIAAVGMFLLPVVVVVMGVALALYYLV